MDVLDGIKKNNFVVVGRVGGDLAFEVGEAEAERERLTGGVGFGVAGRGEQARCRRGRWAGNENHSSSRARMAA